MEKLGKRYRVGLREEFRRSLRESIADWARAGARRKDPKADGSSFWALRDLSFDVEEGEVLAVIGRNGAGKSTLLKVLSRITEPTEGRAEIRGRVGSLLEVGTGFHPELTGRENVFMNGAVLGMRRLEIAKRFDEIVEFAEVGSFIDTPVKHFSSGMYLRLAFSVAAHMEPTVLIVDEVLAVGDALFQKKCLGRMEQVADEGRTVLFVSHNMEAILTLCTKGVVLHEGHVAYKGTAEESVRFYQRRNKRDGDAREPHVCWEDPSGGAGGEAGIRRVEILDLGGRPKAQVRTWDDLCIRVHYTLPKDIRSGSMVLDIRDSRDIRLVVMDSGLKVPLKAGQHYLDCIIRRLPLAAGEFTLGAGLAVSNSHWLWRNTDLGGLLVDGRDVFHLGRPPVLSRMVFAVEHEWAHSGQPISECHHGITESLEPQ